jgi:hypothetical protein
VSEISASCFPTNSVLNLTRSQFNKSPCANGIIFQDAIPIKALDRDYRFQGGSDYQTCVQDVKELFVDKKPCPLNNQLCAFTGAQIADVKDIQFFAISSFWYAIKESSRLWNKELDGDFDTFNSITQQVCSMSMNQVWLSYGIFFFFLFKELKKNLKIKLTGLNNINKAGLEKYRLVQQCFQNVYAIQLLAEYGFSSFDKIKTIDQVILEINAF